MLSKLLYTISRSVKIHARRSLMYIRGKVGDPTKYLKRLLTIKQERVSVIYPRISQLSLEAEKKKVTEAFDQFGQVEKIHLKRLKDVLNGPIDDSTKYYVCQIFGYIAVDEIPTKCPVCNAVQEKFMMED